MAHDHDDHDHHHEHGSELSETQIRVRALESILTEKGYVDPAALDLLIETYEKKVGPHNGARVIAKAWSDPDFRRRLLEDATPAIATVGYAGRQGEHIVALETILTEKGYVDPAALDLLIETYETKVGPRNGARVVARAWSDPAFRARLLKDATPAISELGYAGRQGEHIVAVENTPRLHNMVVCTLCSCYPWPVLGLPPVWYKSAPYRSKAVKDPRGVLADFGFEVPDSTEIRVWDSTAEIRYFVLPMRPAGTEGWSEQRLADLVTRDSMIGTGLPKQPGQS